MAVIRGLSPGAAEKYLKQTGYADTANFGPKPEFFIFDDVRIHTEDHHVSYILDSEELPCNKGKNYPTGNMGHRATTKNGYAVESPVDTLSDIRAEMLTVIESMGISVEKHHHEIAPGQCEIGIKYVSLLESADNVQLYKHAVHNVAHSYGKTATFMPKPINCDNGSGMHLNNQSLVEVRQTYLRRKWLCRPLRNSALLYWWYFKAWPHTKCLYEFYDE